MLMPCPVCGQHDFFVDLVNRAYWKVKDGVLKFDAWFTMRARCPYCFTVVKIRKKRGR